MITRGVGLQGRSQLGDLVEENRAEMRVLELADTRGVGSGERAPLVPEQLALEQLVWQRSAVHLDERHLAARRAPVNPPRDELLANAALSSNEYRGIAFGDLLDDLRDRPHRGAVFPRWARMAVDAVVDRPML
jgi:hypothetical protein